jgi:SynChlorMet cassette protein ScmD
MNSEYRLQTNPGVVLREESDNWAILFDPDRGEGFVIDPVSVFIWNRLDGSHTIEDIVKELHDNFEDVPREVEDHCRAFMDDLIKRGLAIRKSQDQLEPEHG